jgi:hypothetical protein
MLVLALTILHFNLFSLFNLSIRHVTLRSHVLNNLESGAREPNGLQSQFKTKERAQVGRKLFVATMILE